MRHRNWNHDPSMWWWIGRASLMILFWAGVVALAIFLWRKYSANNSSQSASAPTAVAASAEAILAERLARGDIGIDDYKKRLAVLRESASPPPPTT